MPKFVNQLDEKLADAVLASGVDRLTKLNDVREYLKQIPTDRLITEIAAITSLNELRMLQAAGVPFAAQTVYYYQVNKLSGA